MTVNTPNALNHLTHEQSGFVRCIAILLITNSHLDTLYPIPQLATGGALGNALFFLMSGYGLAQSRNFQHRPFPLWFARRIKRVYPSVIIVTVLFDMIFDYGWKKWTPEQYFAAFVWPTDFWFVGALMFFYLLVYPLLQVKNEKGYLLFMVFLLLPYGYYYSTALDLTYYTIEGSGYFKWIFYLQVMLFGGYLGTRTKAVPVCRPYHFMIFAVLLIGYFMLGYFFYRGQVSRYQAVMHFLTIPIVYLVLVFAQTQIVSGKLMNHKLARWIVITIAGATLEIYLLQYHVYSNSLIQSLQFPVNVVAFVVVLLVLSLAMARISGLIRERLSFKTEQQI